MKNSVQKPAALWEKFKKNKYVLAVIAVGLVLILWPGEKKAITTTEKSEQPEFSVAAEEEKIAEALSGIEGAGKVKVVLTLKTGTEQVLAQNEDKSISGTENEEISVSHVIVSKGSANQEPVTLKYIYPEYQGALVVAEGADNAEVRLQLTKAVSGLTGLGSSRITVTKMKKS